MIKSKLIILILFFVFFNVGCQKKAYYYSNIENEYYVSTKEFILEIQMFPSYSTEENSIEININGLEKNIQKNIHFELYKSKTKEKLESVIEESPYMNKVSTYKISKKYLGDLDLFINYKEDSLGVIINKRDSIKELELKTKRWFTFSSH